MSSSTVDAHGKHNGSAFILTCLRRGFSERQLHGRWLPAEQLLMYMEMKFQIGDNIKKFSLSSTMKRVVNKVLPLTSTDPNLLDIPVGPYLQVFRHTFQNRTRKYFFWVTTQVGLRPSLSSQMHSTAWEEDCAVTRLLAGNREQPLSISMLEEPESKRQKKGMIIAGNVASTEQQIALEATRQSNDDRLLAAVPLSSIVDSGHHDGDWWKSGDA
jgi:hypothetical protein